MLLSCLHCIYVYDIFENFSLSLSLSLSLFLVFFHIGNDTREQADNSLSSRYAMLVTAFRISDVVHVDVIETRVQVRPLILFFFFSFFSFFFLR